MRTRTAAALLIVALAAIAGTAAAGRALGRSDAAAPTPGSTASAAGQPVPMYVTGYSYYDNTPPASAVISHPVLHPLADGAGTYADPVTVAVGHSIVDGRDVLDFERGTRFYVPSLRKYLVVEDTCGDGPEPQSKPCHRLDSPGNSAPVGARAWLDIWVGGRSASADEVALCTARMTGLHFVIRDPHPDYPVVVGDIVDQGSCRVGYDELPAQ